LRVHGSRGFAAAIRDLARMSLPIRPSLRPDIIVEIEVVPRPRAFPEAAALQRLSGTLPG
jgi:hypothetical protein